MDWLSLHFVSEIPRTSVILDARHSPELIFFAFLVACLASYSTLTIAERIPTAPEANERRAWTLAAAGSLGCGIWAMHFLEMMAQQAPIAIGYSLATSLLALPVGVVAGLVALRPLGKTAALIEDYALGALALGLGVVLTFLDGALGMQSLARAYYQPSLLILAPLLGAASAWVGIRLAVHFRHSHGNSRLLLKYAASLALGLALAGAHFTAIEAQRLVVPAGTVLVPQALQPAVGAAYAIGAIALLLVGSALGASNADHKLQRKEADLARVNVLLGQLDRARDSLQQLANYDHLTNLFNRRSFTEQFNRRLQEHAESQLPLAVLFLDVDHFKRINDTLGHDAGDDLLKIMAKRIRAVLRNQDLIARFGGDEFCILSPLTDRAEAVGVAQRIMQKIKEPMAIGGRTVVMTASVGICLYPEDGQGSEELLKNADLALYQAKGNGRNAVHLFSNQLKTKASLELQIEEDLRTAIATDALTLFYQPVMDFRSGRILKVEALVRWQHAQHGLLTPDRFVSIAEYNGFIGQLDSWALRRACRELKLLHQRGHPQLKVAVNCSAVNLGHEDMLVVIEETLRQEGLAPGFVELEVTENALMSNIGKAAAMLTKMRELGLGLSIDDFGTGYSSLAYLKSLPINTLKVDRSFIKDIPGDSNDMEITAAIIAMAHKLNLRVIAEGAETLAQMQFLRENDCDQVQGYFIAKPLPLPELENFLNYYEPMPLGKSPLHTVKA